MTKLILHTTQRLSDAASARHYDRDGYLHVDETPITKEQIVGYYGREIANSASLGLDQTHLYQFLRPASELRKAAPTFNGMPLKDNHHEADADNPGKSTTIGSVGTNTHWDAPYIVADITVWDGSAIKRIESGQQKELSANYYSELDMIPGTFQGQHYDGVIRNIVGSHVALVPEGRAGSDVKIRDSKMVDTASDPKAGMPKVFADMVYGLQQFCGDQSQDWCREMISKCIAEGNASNKNVKQSDAEPSRDSFAMSLGVSPKKDIHGIVHALMNSPEADEYLKPGTSQKRKKEIIDNLASKGADKYDTDFLGGGKQSDAKVEDANYVVPQKVSQAARMIERGDKTRKEIDDIFMNQAGIDTAGYKDWDKVLSNAEKFRLRHASDAKQSDEKTRQPSGNETTGKAEDENEMSDVKHSDVRTRREPFTPESLGVHAYNKFKRYYGDNFDEDAADDMEDAVEDLAKQNMGNALYNVHRVHARMFPKRKNSFIDSLHPDDKKKILSLLGGDEEKVSDASPSTKPTPDEVKKMLSDKKEKPMSDKAKQSDAKTSEGIEDFLDDKKEQMKKAGADDKTIKMCLAMCHEAAKLASGDDSRKDDNMNEGENDDGKKKVSDARECEDDENEVEDCSGKTSDKKTKHSDAASVLGDIDAIIEARQVCAPVIGHTKLSDARSIYTSAAEKQGYASADLAGAPVNTLRAMVQREQRRANTMPGVILSDAAPSNYADVLPKKGV